LASAAAVALFAVFGGVGFALAQEAGGDASGTPPAGNPPATSQAPAGQTTAPATGEKLPEVQVIQQKPKAKPKPIKQAKKKPKAPPPSVAAAPPPSPPPSIPEATTQNVEAATEGLSFAQPTEVKMSPVSGSEIPIDKVPSTVSTVTAADIASTGSVVPQDFLAQHVPGI